MNALVRMRNSHARRFEPGWNDSHATIARSSVSWTRSFAVSGSRQIRIATPNSSAWCGMQATSNAWWVEVLSLVTTRITGCEPRASATLGASVVRRTIRDDETFDLDTRDMPGTKAAVVPEATSQ